MGISQTLRFCLLVLTYLDWFDFSLEALVPTVKTSMSIIKIIRQSSQTRILQLIFLMIDLIIGVILGYVSVYVTSVSSAAASFRLIIIIVCR